MITKVDKFIAEKRKTNEKITKRQTPVNETKKLNEEAVKAIVTELNKLVKEGHITSDQSVEQVLELFGFGKKEYVLDDNFKATPAAEEFFTKRADLVKVYTAPLIKQGLDADTVAKAIKALKMFVGDGIPQLKDYTFTYDAPSKKLVIDPNGKGLFNGHPVMG